MRHVSGRPTNRTADVEDVLAALDGQAVREVDRCRQTSRVKMINWREIVNAELVER